jgi:hypothetical protein
VTLKNSLIAYSPQGGNCGGEPLSNNNSDRYSLSSDNTCALAGTGSQNNVDPLLTALGNYGGPTQVHMLKAGSPAIDGVAGSDAPTTDQRGKPRPQGGGYDIGAVERQPDDSDVPPHSVIGDGTPGSCTEAAFATAFNAGGSITFNCGAAPVTIMVTTRYTVIADTTIDGGTFENIILSGGDAGSGPRNGVGFFAVPAGRSLTLQNMVLTHAGDTAIVNAGNLSLISSRVDYARAAACGGIDSVGDVLTNLSLVAYSTVDGNGGGVCIKDGTANLLNSQLYGNIAGGVGGGLYNSGGHIDTSGMYLIGNLALRGGGVYNAANSHLTLLYGVPEYNVARLLLSQRGRAELRELSG